MHISASTIYNSVFFSGTMIIILYLLLKNWKVAGKIRFQLLFFCLALIVIRLLIPVEYFFTVTLFSRHILTVVNDILYYTVWSAAGYDILICHLLFVIWIIGSIARLCKVLYTYFSLQRSIQRAKSIEDFPILQNILSDIIDKQKSKKRFRVVLIPYLSTPMITGILHPCIFLPDVNLSEEELTFILKHETSHYFHGDLLIKSVIEILTVIYWWNPFIYLLEKQVSKALEIHTDMRITKNLSELEQICYLECLVNTAKRHSEASITPLSASFIRNHTTALTQRVNIILNQQKVKETEKFLASLSLLPLFIIALLSFCVIFEARFPSPVTDEYGNVIVLLTEDNAYLIPNASQGYDIYHNGEFFSTISSPDSLGIDLPIYSEKEDNTYE